MVEALISYITRLAAIGRGAVWSTKEDPARTKIELAGLLGMPPSWIPGASGATGTIAEAVLVHRARTRGAR